VRHADIAVPALRYESSVIDANYDSFVARVNFFAMIGIYEYVPRIHARASPPKTSVAGRERAWSKHKRVIDRRNGKETFARADARL
jgi:hypothetical protein